MSRRSEATRRRLIAAARELIATEGLDISLTEVAERAGVTRMTLYRHFGPRRELLLEVLLADVGPLVQRTSEVLADPSVPLAERAHGAMVGATLSLAGIPAFSGAVANGAGLRLEDIDPSGALVGLLASALSPFLTEAADVGLLRGTPEEALAWVTRQLLATAVGRRTTDDPGSVSRETATYFVPSLLRVDDAECQRLASIQVPHAGAAGPLR